MSTCARDVVGPAQRLDRLHAIPGNRGHVVVDEPFYAHYPQVTGLDHPGRDAVIASQPTDWREVAAALHGPVPNDLPSFTRSRWHHLLPDMGREWLDD